MIKTIPNFKYEMELLEQGYNFIIGIDEVGLGAWAGPLITAAVMLPHRIYKINDSKQLSRIQREELAKRIKKTADNWSIGEASVLEIEKLGLREATYLAYSRALESFQNIDFLLIDGIKWKNCKFPYKTIIKGDCKSSSIASASIIAKVERDEIMRKLHREECSKYRFDLHKGYGTKLHQDQLLKWGVSSWHRKNYKPVQKLLNMEGAPRV